MIITVHHGVNIVQGDAHQTVELRHKNEVETVVAGLSASGNKRFAVGFVSRWEGNTDYKAQEADYSGDCFNSWDVLESLLC